MDQQISIRRRQVGSIESSIIEYFGILGINCLHTQRNFEKNKEKVLLFSVDDQQIEGRYSTSQVDMQQRHCGVHQSPKSLRSKAN